MNPISATDSTVYNRFRSAAVGLEDRYPAPMRDRDAPSPCRQHSSTAESAGLADSGRWDDSGRFDDCGRFDETEERTLTATMIGLCVGWFAFGPAGALVGLAVGALVSLR